jgi:hypothetical protein
MWYEFRRWPVFGKFFDNLAFQETYRVKRQACCAPILSQYRPVFDDHDAHIFSLDRS